MCNAIRIVQNQVAAIYVALINSGKFSQQNKINTYNEATIMEQFCPKNEEEENLKK